MSGCPTIGFQWEVGTNIDGCTKFIFSMVEGIHKWVNAQQLVFYWEEDWGTCVVVCSKFVFLRGGGGDGGGGTNVGGCSTSAFQW